MHLNFHWSAVQILWTLTFAAQMVLLVVLLGRDRIRQFPWFTTAILMMTLSRLAGRLLGDRLPPITLNIVFITLADVSAILGFLVVVEMARRAFKGVRPRIWGMWALGVLAVGVGILAAWGPWPSRKTLTADSLIAVLRLMQLGYMKIDMLVDLLTVQLGILVVLLGRRFGAGWKSHTQRLVIGLSTASLAQLAAQTIWQFVAKTASPHSQAEYERILGLREKLFNADAALYVAVFVWWIAVLWIDEPGGGDVPALATPQAEYLTPEGVDVPVDDQGSEHAAALNEQATGGE